MRTLTLPGGTRVRLFQSIFELSATRHNELQHWLVRGAGIGSGVGAIDRHFSTVTAYLAADKREEAADALALLHYAFAETLAQFSPKHLAFGVLVASVDEVPCQDFSEPGLEALLATLSELGLTEQMVTAEVEDVKKNWQRS